ncbi:hypothetical protein BGZ94_007698 [Podila epigama]|nr:hypothetical protein BGZ94_007698 [Podila epigama]
MVSVLKRVYNKTPWQQRRLSQPLNDPNYFGTPPQHSSVLDDESAQSNAVSSPPSSNQHQNPLQRQVSIAEPPNSTSVGPGAATSPDAGDLATARTNEKAPDVGGTDTVAQQPQRRGMTRADTKISFRKSKKDSRRVFLNIPPPAQYLDSNGLPKASYGSNRINTAKYTTLTFLPKNLFEQFRRVANMFFLFMAIIQLTPIFTVGSPFLTVFPLCFVVGVTAIKDGFEDYKRHVEDRNFNQRICHQLKNIVNHNYPTEQHIAARNERGYLSRAWSSLVHGLGTGKKKVMRTLNLTQKPSRELHDFDVSQLPIEEDPLPSIASQDKDIKQKAPQPEFVKEQWHNLRVGDFIMLKNNQAVPADAIILSTSETEGSCFIETKDLDGETNLKTRMSLHETSKFNTARRCSRLKCFIDIEPINANLFSFNGSLTLLTRKKRPSNTNGASGQDTPGVSTSRLSRYTPSITSSMLSSVRGSMDEDDFARASNDYQRFPEGNEVSQPAGTGSEEGTSASEYARFHRAAFQKRRSRFSESLDASTSESVGGDKQEWQQEPSELESNQEHRHGKRNSLYRTATAHSMGGASEMARNVLKAKYEQQLQEQHQQKQQQEQQQQQRQQEPGDNVVSKDCPYKETTIPVDINNMLLRGHVIRNTYWVIAVIVATGTDTKIMLNSGETPSKRSRIEKTMNIQVALNFLILLVLCIVCAVGSSIYDRQWRSTSAEELWDMTTRGVVIEGVITFFTSLIIFQNIIPISLYISIEFVKTFQAYFIWQDSDMYDVELDEYCTPKTWNLTDDLGQIEYVFSDKTGTLTRNIMEFKKCSINGKIYGNNAVAGQTDAEKGMEMMNQGREPGSQQGVEAAKSPDQQPANRDSHQQEKTAVLQEFDEQVRKLFEPAYMDPLEILTFADPEVLRDLIDQTGSKDDQTENTSSSTFRAGNGEGSSSSTTGPQQNRTEGNAIVPVPQHDGSPSSNIYDYFTLLALCHTVVIEQPEETIDDDDDDEFGMYDETGSPGTQGTAEGGKGDSMLTPDHHLNRKENDEGQHFNIREKLKHAAESHGLVVPGATPSQRSGTDAVTGSGFGNRSRNTSNAASIGNPLGVNEDKPKPTICYRAESPDEAALVAAAKNVGFAFVSRGTTAVTGGSNGDKSVEDNRASGEKGNSRQNVNLNVLGKDYAYEQLDVIKFNSTRKRMTVIVREPAELGGKILLLTKGADNVIFERLSPEGQDGELRDQTERDIETFSNMGLRTLTLAQRVLDDATYEAWANKYAEASKALDDRAKKMDQVAEEIECNLTLLGATAIEDKLQEGVPDAIAALREAGIKVWVLTGDKLETAINIGFASRLLEKDMKLAILKMNRNEQPSSVLQRFKQLVTDVMSGKGVTSGTVLDPKVEQQDEIHEKTPSSQPQLQRQPPQQFQDRGNTWDDKRLPPTPDDDLAVGGKGVQHALIVDGSALKVLLDDPDARKDLIRLSDVCFSVICCRASPLQKALVVELIRRGKKTICLAIGDGANDVSMIQAANIGVGIAGQEGMQAAMASDYSISQFRFIKKLVLVHGHWGYMRIAEMILNFFFKNVLWVAAVLWFQIYCGFSAMLFYDYTFVSLYNLMLTAVPVLVLGATDQDVTAPYVLRYPGVYKLGIEQKRYGQMRFVAYMLDGVWQSLVVFWFWRGVFGVNVLATSGLDASLLEFSTSVAITNVVIASLYVGFHTYHWTWIMHFAVWGSIIFLWLLVLIYGAVESSPIYHVALHLCSQGPFWFMLVLSVITALLARYTVVFVSFWWFPDDVHVVRGIMISEKRQAIAKNVPWTGLAPDGMTPQEQTEQEKAILRKEDLKREAKAAEKAEKEAAKNGSQLNGDEQPYDMTMIKINVDDHSQQHESPTTSSSNAKNPPLPQQQPPQYGRQLPLTPLEMQEKLLNRQSQNALEPENVEYQHNRRKSSLNDYSNPPAPLPAPSPSLPSLPASAEAIVSPNIQEQQQHQEHATQSIHDTHIPTPVAISTQRGYNDKQEIDE